MKTPSFSMSYQKLCAEYYELDKPIAPKNAVEYYLQQSQEMQGPILEPMCGTGRFLIPLVEAGFDVTGFDNSRHMLDICREKCQSKNLQCQLFDASFESYKPTNKYQLVFIPSGSFCLLTDLEKAARALKYIHAWLDERGKFIFEVETSNAIGKLQGIWKANWVKKPDGSLIILNYASQYDQKSSIETVLCRYEHWKNNIITRTEVEEFCVRLYKASEIEELLSQHGFRVMKSLAPYTIEKAPENAEVILYECVKK